MRTLFLTAMLVALWLVRDAVGADAPTAPVAADPAALRFEQANLEDLVGRLKAERGRTPGVWAQVCLTREIVLAEAELKKINEQLRPESPPEKPPERSSVTYEPPKAKKGPVEKTKETRETKGNKEGARDGSKESGTKKKKDQKTR